MQADKNLKYWIRPASLTTDAKQDEISELFDKFNSVPFDDRVNRKATIDNIRHYSLPKKSPMRQIQNWILEISGF